MLTPHQLVKSALPYILKGQSKDLKYEVVNFQINIALGAPVMNPSSGTHRLDERGEQLRRRFSSRINLLNLL